MTFYLALSSLLVAAAAIGWLLGINKRLSELGMRVLESDDIEKIIEAANKTAFFESRVAACEEGTNQSRNQLAEHATKLGELAANLGATERLANGNKADFAEVSEKTASFESRVAACEDGSNQSRHQLAEHETRLGDLAANLGATERLANGNRADFAEVSEKMASFESRVAECENRAEQGANQLSEQQTKVNELVAGFEAAEQMLDEHAAGIAQAGRSMKVAADEIHSLEKFQTATERARNLILATLNDIWTSVPAEGCSGTRVDTTESEEASPGPGESQQEDDVTQMDHQAMSSEVGANQAVRETGSWQGDFGTA